VQAEAEEIIEYILNTAQPDGSIPIDEIKGWCTKKERIYEICDAEWSEYYRIPSCDRLVVC
jgi:hypothetical protein